MAKRILVVDDAPDARFLMNRLLTGLGCEVVLAESGQEAIEKTQYQKFSAIILDIQMPGIDGWQTATSLRQLGVTCPIVALSGNTSADDERLSSSAGMDAHWVKPIKKVQLKDWIAGLQDLEPQT